MTKQELENFEKELQDRGYRKYSASNSADYAWYKSFGKSEYDENRCNYQIAFSVWDFSEFARRADCLEKYSFNISPSIMVSRCIDERTDLEINHTRDIEKIEQLAERFFRWVETNIKIEQSTTKNVI